MGNLNSGFGNMGRTVMTHALADMSVVECQTNGLGGLISGVDDTRYIGHFHNATCTPVLEGKILNVIVTGAF